MKKKIITLTLLTGLISGCGVKETTQIAENTFVYKEKVYKIVDNELAMIGDLKSDSIRKFEILKPTQKDLGSADISFVKAGASTKLDALYRGNILYFKLFIIGINDLRDNYSTGMFTINFKDEFDFILHKTEISTNELTRVLDENNNINYFEYNGKTEMSTEINKSIKSYSVSSSVKKGAGLNW